jgi:hypothetical protein
VGAELLKIDARALRGAEGSGGKVTRETPASKALKEARELVKQRDYAEALAKYIWFHEHALEHEPAMAGVRLSYAIMEWVDLGGEYPPARVALEAVRDTKTKALEAGSTEVGLFFDLHAINRALEQPERTRDLFAKIAERDREFAKKCFSTAMDALVQTREFSLARSFLVSPDEELSKIAALLNRQIRPKDLEPGRPVAAFRDTLITIFVRRVKAMLQILAGAGDEDEARRTHAAAVAYIEDEQIRDRVAALLSPQRASKLVQ